MDGHKKILLFLGAGTGVPIGLPTSTGFNDEVRAQPLAAVTQHAIRYLGGTESEDIERILATLESFQTDVSLTEFLLPNLVAGLPQTPPTMQSHLQNQLANFKGQALSEVMRIKKILFQKLNVYDPGKASTLYRGIFSELKDHYKDFALSVITTNYDLTFESVIEDPKSDWKSYGIKDFEFGFSVKYGRPIFDPDRDFSWRADTVEFLKVHGSLDWHRDAQDRCSRSMSKTVPDNPNQMAILYPGFKGVPQTEPFSTLHGRLNQRLAEADIVIVVGFAFRDSYINSIFENVLRLRKDSIQLFYLNPLPLDKHPKESMAPHFASRHSGFVVVKKGIEATATPLGLAAFPSS